MTAATQDTAPPLTGATLAEQLRQCGYVLSEMPADAPDSAKLEAITGALAVACVVQARQAEQLDGIVQAIGAVAAFVDHIGPIAEQLAAGGPGAILGLLTGRNR